MTAVKHCMQVIAQGSVLTYLQHRMCEVETGLNVIPHRDRVEVFEHLPNLFTCGQIVFIIPVH